MFDRCLRMDSSRCDPAASGDMTQVTTRGLLPHTPVTHTVFSLYPTCRTINLCSSVKRAGAMTCEIQPCDDFAFVTVCINILLNYD